MKKALIIIFSVILVGGITLSVIFFPYIHSFIKYDTELLVKSGDFTKNTVQINGKAVEYTVNSDKATWQEKGLFLSGEGRLSFAKIKNKKRRKNLATIEMETLQLIAPKGAPELRNYHENMNIIKRDYTSGQEDHKVYEAIYTQGEDVVDIMFEPDDNMLDMMARRYASRIKRGE